VTIAADHPSPPHLLFSSRAGRHLLVSTNTQIYDMPATSYDEGSQELSGLLSRLSDQALGAAPLNEISEPDPQSISLNVSSICNLGCGYCYAGGGAFNGAQRNPMSWDIARAAIDKLISSADRSRPVTIGFLGGEPFVARDLIHQVVDYAMRFRERDGLDVRFSVTTNGTQLHDRDVQLLQSHPFAVTVSLDGGPQVHNLNRPTRGGGDSWALAISKIKPLLEDPGQSKIAARATVTTNNLDVEAHFNALCHVGFCEIGFSPLRLGASAVRSADHWQTYLTTLIRTADAEIALLRRGRALRLSNLNTALKELHRGAASPYPCGAGGGYFSVASNGDWYACHRAVGNPDFKLGSNDGLDREARRNFLQQRHVDAQVDCATCWARYLCSGGCHQEAASRTPESCDFVRAWLKYCLVAYCELQEGATLAKSA